MPIVPTPAAEPSRADHQHARGEQFRLTGAADLAKHDVPRIPLKLFVGKCHGPTH
jgi:hypothetical protein